MQIAKAFVKTNKLDPSAKLEYNFLYITYLINLVLRIFY